MKKLAKQKIAKKKGFTLVEIIVVLVILAILMAATVPSMIAFVNDARGKAYAAEARTGLVAAQMVVTEVIGGGAASITSAQVIAHANFRKMVAEVTERAEKKGEFKEIYFDGNRVVGVEYLVDGRTIIINNGTTTIS